MSRLKFVTIFAVLLLLLLSCGDPDSNQYQGDHDGDGDHIHGDHDGDGDSDHSHGDHDGDSDHDGDDNSGEEDPLLAEELEEGSCRSRVASAEGGTFHELCSLEEGVVGHFRIDRFRTAGMHASTQLLFGFPEPPTSTTVELQSDQFRLMIYGLTPDSFYPSLGAREGDIQESTGFDVEGVDFTQEQTLCADIFAGGGNASSSILFWLDGVNGADCSEPATLHLRSIVGEFYGEHGDEARQLNLEGGAYFYQAASVDSAAVITLFDAPKSGCETLWETTTDWQSLCETRSQFGGGHYRVESAQTGEGGTNQYLSLIIGEESSLPEGNPSAAEDTQTLILYGGASNTGDSVNWISFNGQNTGFQAQRESFQTDNGEPFFTQRAMTFCADIWQDQKDEGPEVRVRMWATGANGANCKVPSTLTVDAVLYDRTFPGELRENGHDFIKTNNEALTLTRVFITNPVSEF